MDAVCELVMGRDAAESVSQCQKRGGKHTPWAPRVVDLLLASSVGGERKRGQDTYLWDPRTSLDTKTTRLSDVERARDREW